MPINPAGLSPQARQQLAMLLSQEQARAQDRLEQDKVRLRPQPVLSPDIAKAIAPTPFDNFVAPRQPQGMDAGQQQGVMGGPGRLAPPNGTLNMPNPRDTPQPQRLTASVMPGSDRGVMKEPQGGGWANVLGTIGATLQDTGMALNGGQGNALSSLQATRRTQEQELEALRQQRIGDKLIGSLAQSGGDIRSMFANNPQAVAQLLRTPGGAEMINMLQPAPRDIHEVGGALVEVGQDGVNELYRAPQEPDAGPPSVQEYQFAVGQGYGGSYADWQTEDANRRKPVNNINVNNAPTDAQAAAATYYTRANDANGILTNVEGAGTNFWDRVASNLPGGNYMVSNEWQLFDQAKRDFVNAVLRRESGAVINEEEFINADRQYFPQPGDSEAVIRQKSANRRNAINGLQASSGNAINLMGGGQQNAPVLDDGGSIDDLLRRYGN